MPKLILLFKDKVLTTYPITEGGALTVGRHPENDIIIDNLAVSSRHARIEHINGKFELTDLDSKNGTLLNGKSVHQCALNDRDVIGIGKHMLKADWKDRLLMGPEDEGRSCAAEPADFSSTMMLESANLCLEPTGKARPCADCIAFLAGGKGELLLSRKDVAIGKNRDADIVVGGMWAFLMGAPAAVITKQAGDYFLRHTGGWIKPKRNGAGVKGTVKLSHEDVVSLGPVKFEVQLCERAAG
ncbi:MAG: FHA domain-containing protein [Desulfatitalea sp.]|nr:FHA domain-containing protein [Desulfatitalea sp.]NNK01288.1 FHA domain-containing protein [Desulfatitalea sp.]